MIYHLMDLASIIFHIEYVFTGETKKQHRSTVAEAVVMYLSRVTRIYIYIYVM